MPQIIGIAIGYYIGGKIGHELFRYNHPDSSYQPPPFWGWRI
jgi:hypothetical protein